MNFCPLSFLRFRKNPPGKRPPPKNQIDLRFQPSTGEFVFENDQGVVKPVGGEGSILYDPEIQALDTGASDSLDAISTVSLPVGLLRCISPFGYVYTYKLTAGTDAESIPYYVRPDDYAEGTNEKVWTLVSPVSNLSLAQTVGIAGGNSATIASLKATQVVGSKTYQLPSVAGTALARTSQADGSITEADITLSAAYADDAAAATGGVAVGDIYRKTDGTVAWRQA